jgi:hypothetical protein
MKKNLIRITSESKNKKLYRKLKDKREKDKTKIKNIKNEKNN